MAECESTGHFKHKPSRMSLFMMTSNINKTDTMHTAQHPAWEFSLLHEKEDFFFVSGKFFMIFERVIILFRGLNILQLYSETVKCKQSFNRELCNDSEICLDFPLTICRFWF